MNDGDDDEELHCVCVEPELDDDDDDDDNDNLAQSQLTCMSCSVAQRSIFRWLAVVMMRRMRWL